MLEVVLAIAILTAVSLGTSLLLIPIARQTRINRETEIANAEVQKVLEQFQATPFDALLDSYPPGWAQTIPELPSGSINVSYTDPTADPLLIHATLSWVSPELGDMQLNFDTVRTE